MNDKLSRQNCILYVCGILPVVWLALLCAPLLEGGMGTLLEGFGTALENPFHIIWCDNVIVVPEIHKGIVAVAPFGINQVQDLDDIALFLQQMAGVSQKFSFGVLDHKGSVGLHDIRLRVKASLAGTGTTADQDI